MCGLTLGSLQVCSLTLLCLQRPHSFVSTHVRPHTFAPTHVRPHTLSLDMWGLSLPPRTRLWLARVLAKFSLKTVQL